MEEPDDGPVRISNRKRATIKRVTHDAVRRYYAMYNGELEEFFEVVSDDISELRTSVIHARSECQYIQRERSEGEGQSEGQGEGQSEDEDESKRDEEEYEECGTLWEAAEKRAFFRLLSRYSIHRVAEWRHMIPSKSLAEICMYYNVLKRNTQLLRGRKSKGLLRVRDLPIAYEVDEPFVEMEEYMSAKPLNKYAAAQDVPEPEQKPGHSLLGLISLPRWQHRWKAMYSNAGLPDLYPMSRISAQVHPLAMQYLEQLIRARLRLLLWRTVLPVLPNRSIHRSRLLPKSRRTTKTRAKGKKRAEAEAEAEGDISTDTEEDIDTDTEEDIDTPLDIRNGTSAGAEFTPAVISAEHVRRAVRTLQHDAAAAAWGVGGRRDPFAPATLAESVATTLRKFNVAYAPASGSVFRDRRIRAGIVPAVLGAVEAAAAAELQPLSLPQRATGAEDGADEWHETPARLARGQREDDACDAEDMRRSRQYSDAVFAYIMQER